ncbi:MAG: hypothetical protein HXX80_04320 [Nitrososphaerales archaeon]|nr:hypothetical protein [Nitrososphaerales archaeon]
MTVFMVETYVIKPEKPADFTTYKNKLSQWIKKRPELFKEVKSYRMFAQMLGGKWGGHVEMWEFKNLANCEKCFNRVLQSEYKTKYQPEFLSLVAPAT